MLNDAQLRNLKPRESAYRVSDGGGLMIQVEKNGSKLWRIAYRFEKKQKMISGGKYPTVTLAAARAWRDRIKDILARGEDPSLVLKAERDASPVDHSFRAAGERWFEIKTRNWGEKARRRVESRLLGDVYPAIGKKHVADVSPQDVIALLRKVEARGVGETVWRVRSFCHDIFAFAKVEGWCETNPASDIQPALKTKPPAVHRRRIAPKDMGSFLARQRTDEASEMTHLALRLTILTWARTGEVRFASIDEMEGLDGPEPLWRLSAERMKMDREHVVPLSRQAVAIVKRLREMNPHSRMLFSVHYSKSGVISENRMLDVMYRLGLRGKATVHGFRGTASTWANEQMIVAGDPPIEVRKYHEDWVELALAHGEPNKVRGAYNSALHLGARRRLLQDWADWLDEQEELAALVG
ncbi:tyrosine-type recombinase/integrase [Sphingobium lignivorans]|uniref:Integrase n=1 Tax=Sphingobium lignivorans TaxID=2735886 RepID=A0ABR6NF62_9SPHN|nr:integrase arm-type DNA-binding domain-containing protein [Sphingobium lignivorans]MBB5985917.1 integrase [Sphingobium lignivorans]